MGTGTNLHSWFAVRRELTPRARTVLGAGSFLLPLLIWCVVSYVPGVWHPMVLVTDPGDVDYFQVDMLVDREVYADRMYYDVTNRRGTVLQAEMLTPVREYEGLLRLQAEVLQQTGRDSFFARDTFITSSRMGRPGYRIQAGEIRYQDIPHPATDPATGLPLVNPDTQEPVGPGERGEMVITMLQKEAFPLIRYRIGDISVIHEDRCSCGRTHPRISRITGRVDDMLIIRGINVFPSQVEYSLLTNPELGNEFQIVIDRKGALDDMLVRAELKPEAFTDNINQLNALKERVEGRLKDLLNVGVEIELVEPGSLPRFEGKAKRVVDRRVY